MMPGIAEDDARVAEAYGIKLGVRDMTEAKHTPGPWTTEDKDGWYPWPESIGIFSGEGEVIAWTTSTAAKRNRDEANARLIAAAPDLLEALNDLMDAAFMADRKYEIDARQKATAAIAKATGAV